MNTDCCHSKQASALIITLIMVVAVCVVLVGFTTTARLEQGTVAAYSNAEAAANFRDMATDTAVARLMTATAEGSFWASAPGRIFSMAKNPTGWGDPLVVDLSSGAGVDPSHAANLNPGSIIHTGGVLQESMSMPLYLRWIYVRQDGTLENGDSVPAYQSTNPLVGRYAFWVDDLSARINLNTAATRSANTEPLSHPSRVDLTSLEGVTPSVVSEVKNFRQTRLLNSTGEAVAIDEILADWTLSESLSFTPYNHSSDTNVFGEPKLVLTTKAAIANNQPFFNITKNEGDDPALFDNLDVGGVSDVFDQIYAILSRTDRPLMGGRSYVQKYGQRQAVQMAIDLIDYVRAADSTTVAVEPIRGSFSTATNKFTLSAGAVDFIANGRRPYITQIAVTVSTPPTGGWRFEYAIEVYIPPWEGGGVVDLSTMRLYIGLWGGGTHQVDISSAMLVGGSSEINSGESKTLRYGHTVFGATPPPNPLPLHLALFNKTTTRRFEIVALGTSRIMFPYEEPTPASVYDTPSVAVDDPFINKVPANWVLGLSDFNRAAGVTSRQSSLGAPAAASQDSDATGNVTNLGVRVPAPGAGVRSVGEIGHIHTGSHGSPETPWRTIRLQPSDSDLPDWLLLDDFSVPLLPSGSPSEVIALAPFEGAVGGRINLNALLYPFAIAEASAVRPIPFNALLHGVNEAGAPIGETRRTALASSILNQNPASGTQEGNFHLPDIADIDQFYLFPGQLSEVHEVAIRGEESENLVRQITPLLTTRGALFEVYSIGQSLRQGADGQIHILGERYSITMLERKERFRVLLQKEVAP